MRGRVEGTDIVVDNIRVCGHNFVHRMHEFVCRIVFNARALGAYWLNIGTFELVVIPALIQVLCAPFHVDYKGGHFD